MAKRSTFKPLPVASAVRHALIKNRNVRAAQIEALSPADERRFAADRAKQGAYVPRKNGKLAFYYDVFESNSMTRDVARQWAKDEGHSVGSVMQAFRAWAEVTGRE